MQYSWKWTGSRRNIKIPSCRYRDSHYKIRRFQDRLIFMEIPIHKKTLFILRQGPDCRYHYLVNQCLGKQSRWTTTLCSFYGFFHFVKYPYLRHLCPQAAISDAPFTTQTFKHPPRQCHLWFVIFASRLPFILCIGVWCINSNVWKRGIHIICSIKYISYTLFHYRVTL